MKYNLGMGSVSRIETNKTFYYGLAMHEKDVAMRTCFGCAIVSVCLPDHRLSETNQDSFSVIVAGHRAGDKECLLMENAEGRAGYKSI